MLIGQAYSYILTPRERQALQDGCDLLIDYAFDDLATLESPQDVVHTMLARHLPQRYTYKYTPLFFRQFTVCHITVTWRVSPSSSHTSFISCRRDSSMDNHRRSKEDTRRKERRG